MTSLLEAANARRGSRLDSLMPAFWALERRPAFATLERSWESSISVRILLT
jgi:hypothetical protein